MIVLGPDRGIVSFYASSGPGILPVRAMPYSLTAFLVCLLGLRYYTRLYTLLLRYK